MRSLVLCALLAAVAVCEERPAKELLAALSSTDYQTRRKAVLAVEGREEPALLDRLIAIAQHDPNSNIRAFAAGVLGTFRDDKRVFPLLTGMVQKEDYGVRTHAYVALGKLGDPRALQTLLAGLGEQRGMRGYAAKGLGLLGDPKGFEPVKALYRKHVADPYVAEMAPEDLARMDRGSALKFLHAEFATLPRSATFSVARVLARYGNDETRALMEKLLTSDDAAARRSAIRVLSGLASKESTPALLAHLKRRPAERAAVFEALGKSGDIRAVAPLVNALRDEKELLPKMRLIEALGRLGDKGAYDALREQIRDERVLLQSRRTSAIHGFPYNARVDAAAAWAILKIRHGKEPFPLSDVSRFPGGQPPAHVLRAISGLRKG